MAPDPEDQLVSDPGDRKSKSFTAFRSAAEEAEMKGEEPHVAEGGHMSSTAGRVMRVPGAKLPYIVTLTHHLADATKHFFATMREAEAFIKRNTPLPRALLSTIYDRPAAEFQLPLNVVESDLDLEIASRLKRIDERLRQFSSDEAVSVVSAALAYAGINGRERMKLLTATERVLDEQSGKLNN